MATVQIPKGSQGLLVAVPEQALWDEFERSNPFDVLNTEMERLYYGDNWDDLGFSIASYQTINRHIMIRGVDIFVVLLVLYRTRQLVFDDGGLYAVRVGNGAYVPHVFTKSELTALNSMGIALRVLNITPNI
jgi:hypothetical protein